MENKQLAIVDYTTFKDQVMVAFQSGLLPKSIDTPQKAIAIALTGRELGLKPMESLMGLYVVNGKVTLSSALMLRLIYERCPGAKITVLSSDEKEAQVEMERPGGTSQKFSFTMEEAKRAGFLNKRPWQEHPATMLRWAAIRTGARVVFADAIAGCYMPDELPEERLSPKPTEVKVSLPAYRKERKDDFEQSLERTQEIEFEKMPWEKDAYEIEKAKIPFGKYQGVWLNQRSATEWEIYMLEVQKALKERDLDVNQKKEAISIIDVIQQYLEHVAMEPK